MDNIAFHKELYNDLSEKSFDELDESQKQAIDAQTEGGKIIIQASAGAGKTKTLIAAICAYRYNNLNDRICAITYTRAARAEMEQRLFENKIYDIDVTTIHVWSRNLLELFARRYDFKINILQERDIKIILEDLFSYYKSKKNKPYLKVNIDILYNFIMGNKNMDISDKYRGLLKTLEGLYIDYKKTNMLYDFTDYPRYLYDVLNAYNEKITGIDALFVDEFQDVDPIQLQLFEKIENCNQKFFIGDKKQSIFVFRGADGKAFEKIKRQKDFKVYKLNRNYRSYQRIIDYACTVYEKKPSFITDVCYWKPSDIKCVKGTGGFVAVIPEGCTNGKTLDGDQFETARLIEEFLKEEPMILCRTNKQVKAIQELHYTNVQTIHQAKGLEYDNVIVFDMCIDSEEDLNIAYVALTRAKDKLVVITFGDFYYYYLKYMEKEMIF